MRGSPTMVSITVLTTQSSFGKFKSHLRLINLKVSSIYFCLCREHSYESIL
uniref:Uncharacterized protein n=1 Tax=Rhizophora mucronata TaxID=61149 RepID=A0A2P2PKA6_RHIMU